MVMSTTETVKMVRNLYFITIPNNFILVVIAMLDFVIGTCDRKVDFQR